MTRDQRMAAIERQQALIIRAMVDLRDVATCTLGMIQETSEWSLTESANAAMINQMSECAEALKVRLRAMNLDPTVETQGRVEAMLAAGSGGRI